MTSPTKAAGLCSRDGFKILPFVVNRDAARRAGLSATAELLVHRNIE